MALSTYSFLGTPLHLSLDDEVASNYNKFVDALCEAQSYYKRTHGHSWNGRDTIEIDTPQYVIDDYNAVGEIIRLMIKVNHNSPIRREDETSDYLVKVS